MEKVRNVEECQRLPIMSPLYNNNYLYNKKQKIEKNDNLNKIIDQEIDHRSIPFLIKSPKIINHNASKFICNQQQKELNNEILQQNDKNIIYQQKSIQNAIDILDKELNSYNLQIQHQFHHYDTSKAVVLSRKEIKQRLITKQINDNNDEKIKNRNIKYIKMLMESWKIGTEKLSKNKKMLNKLDSKLIKENIKEVTGLERKEKEKRVRTFSSNQTFSIIGYNELNVLTEIEIIERERECMEFLLEIAEKCHESIKLNKNTTLLEIWNNRKKETEKRRNKNRQRLKNSKKRRTDWILYINCKNAVNPKKSRLLKQIKQFWHLHRMTKTEKFTNNKFVAFLPRNITSSANNQKKSTIKKKNKVNYNKYVSGNYSMPTFTFQSKINPENIGNKLHKKLFKTEKSKIESKSQTQSPQKKANNKDKKPIKIDVNIMNNNNNDNNNINISEYISPINQWIEKQTNAIDKIENDNITSSISTTTEQQIFKVHQQHKTTPNKNIFQRLSKPKKRKNINNENKNQIVIKNEIDIKNKKLGNSKVFEKLYKDANIRRARHSIAKGLADSAKLENIKSKCSFQPKLYKTQTIWQLQHDGLPVHQRMKQWEIKREKNLQKLIENDPVRKICTFQPIISKQNKTIYDYSQPNQMPIYQRLMTNKFEID